MARSDPQLNFRIPVELRDKLDAAARENNRSLTGELIARLERTFSDEPAVNGISMSAIFEKLEEIESSIKAGKFPAAKPSSK
jgi:hypothetical protein